MITLFLCGDVMTGRGVDQLLPHGGDPRLHEPYIRNSGDYLLLAEERNGPIARPVGFDYIWGDALEELDARAPALRVINLETSITTSDDPWPGKGIHYRMHPANSGCLPAARIDACVLANNHVLDWGRAGLVETLATLDAAGIRAAGAGRDSREASRPLVWERGGGRVVLMACAMPSSGVPGDWAARDDRPGINVLSGSARRDLQPLAEIVAATRRAGDVVVFSIHWGGNWGYEVPAEDRVLAHRLIDEVGVDLVHGHSSHHFKGIEVHDGRLILYGSGDFLNDYEGIRGHESFRDSLTLMYFPTLRPEDGTLARLVLVPMEIRNVRLNRVSAADASWVEDVLNREGERFGTRVTPRDDGSFELAW